MSLEVLDPSPDFPPLPFPTQSQVPRPSPTANPFTRLFFVGKRKRPTMTTRPHRGNGDLDRDLKHTKVGRTQRETFRGCGQVRRRESHSSREESGPEVGGPGTRLTLRPNVTSHPVSLKRTQPENDLRLPFHYPS